MKKILLCAMILLGNNAINVRANTSTVSSTETSIAAYLPIKTAIEKLDKNVIDLVKNLESQNPSKKDVAFLLTVAQKKYDSTQNKIKGIMWVRKLAIAGIPVATIIGILVGGKRGKRISPAELQEGRGIHGITRYLVDLLFEFTAAGVGAIVGAGVGITGETTLVAFITRKINSLKNDATQAQRIIAILEQLKQK